MVKFSTLARGLMAGAFCMIAWGGSAHAVLLSDVFAYQQSPGTLSAPTLTVGDITFTFTSCGGRDCMDTGTTPFGKPYNQNFEIVGVAASPSTGPGGGIMVRSIATAPPGTPVLHIDSDPTLTSSELSLNWTATSANSIVGARGSAVGTGVNAGGGGSTTLTNPGALGKVNMDPNLSSADVIAFAAQTTVYGQADYNISSGSLKSSTVFLSQVPEPISLSLLLTGLAGLGYARRRRAG